MNAAQRLPYVEMLRELDWELCTFCSYDKSNGCDCGRECQHPLEHRLAIPEYDLVSDCWGFRPDYPINDIADIIGITLAQGWQAATWWEDGDKLRIVGRGEVTV